MDDERTLELVVGSAFLLLCYGSDQIKIAMFEGEQRRILFEPQWIEEEFSITPLESGLHVVNRTFPDEFEIVCKAGACKKESRPCAVKINDSSKEVFKFRKELLAGVDPYRADTLPMRLAPLVVAGNEEATRYFESFGDDFEVDGAVAEEYSRAKVYIQAAKRCKITMR